MAKKKKKAAPKKKKVVKKKKAAPKKKKVAKKKKATAKKKTGGASERQIKAGLKKYEDFRWGKKAKSIRARKSPDFEVLVNLGEAVSIEYAVKKGDRRVATYRHRFKLERPAQVYSTVNGKALVIMGGKLKVTERGIEG